jgi:hypothetical protein
MIVGLTIAVGAKENFAVMGILVVSLLIILKHYNKITKIAIISSTIMFIVNLYQILYIYTMQSNQSVDLYQNDITVIYRLQKIVGNMLVGYTNVFTISSIIFVGLLSIFLFIFFKNKFKSIEKTKEIFDKLFFVPMIFFSVSVLFFLFNLYIYDGVFKVDGRYAFPFVLIVQVLLLIIIRWIFEFKMTFFSTYNFKYTIIFYWILIIALSCTLIYTIQQSWQLSAKNVEATKLFQDNIAEIIKLSLNNENANIIFSSYHAKYDYEPIRSVAVYLRYYGVKNNLSLKTNYDLVNNEEAFSHKTNIENKKIEKDGNEEFIPYVDLNTTTECIIIDFTGDTDYSKCQEIKKVWRHGDYPYAIAGNTFKYFNANINFFKLK